MIINALNKRVTFRIPTDPTTADIEQPEYIDGKTVWAAVQPLRGREFWQAQAVQSESTVKITTRYISGIKPDFQIRLPNEGENIDYEITNIIDVNMLHEWLEFMCKVVQK
jgi:SPP1 family predicted phage head-tail adaptor